jgi:hypothetical protein
MRSSRRLAKLDLDHRQMRIKSIMSACDVNLNIWYIPGVPARRNKLLGGCMQDFSAERFFGRQDAELAMRPTRIVPTHEVVQPSLQGRVLIV